MLYRRLGRTGLQVSALSFGAWVTFGTSVGRGEARRLITQAFDAGINFFDNAETYAKGEAERIMGDVLADMRFPRDAFAVSSKVYFGAAAEPSPAKITADPTATPANESCATSRPPSLSAATPPNTRRMPVRTRCVPQMSRATAANKFNKCFMEWSRSFYSWGCAWACTAGRPSAAQNPLGSWCSLDPRVSTDKQTTCTTRIVIKLS